MLSSLSRRTVPKFENKNLPGVALRKVSVSPVSHTQICTLPNNFRHYLTRKVKGASSSDKAGICGPFHQLINRGAEITPREAVSRRRGGYLKIEQPISRLKRVLGNLFIETISNLFSYWTVHEPMNPLIEN